MYAGIARNIRELEASLRLAALVFRNFEDEGEALANKSALMFQQTMRNPSNVVCLVDNDQEVVGTCFIIERHFYRAGRLLKGVFLSSICVHDEQRGKGLSRLLMEAAVKASHARGALFAVVIARRDVDHYYNRFGFWGLSQYSRLMLGIGQILNLSSAQTNYRSEPINSAYAYQALDSLYNAAYSSSFGACRREPGYWAHLNWKVRLMGLSAVSFYREDELYGYAAFTENKIHEIAAANVDCYQHILQYVQQGCRHEEELEIHCDITHPVVECLSGLDYSHKRRECSFGGHMVRVLDASSLDSILSGKTVPAARGAVDEPPDMKHTLDLMRANSLSAGYLAQVDRLSFNIPLLDQC